MRFIILKNVSPAHQTLTLHLIINFWKKKKKIGNYSISHVPNLGNLLVKNNINDGQIVTFYNIKMVVGVNFFTIISNKLNWPFKLVR
jgi:hypothetical protein